MRSNALVCGFSDFNVNAASCYCQCHCLKFLWIFYFALCDMLLMKSKSLLYFLSLFMVIHSLAELVVWETFCCSSYGSDNHVPLLRNVVVTASCPCRTIVLKPWKVLWINPFDISVKPLMPFCSCEGLSCSLRQHWVFWVGSPSHWGLKRNRIGRLEGEALGGCCYSCCPWCPWDSLCVTAE
jgi:hypothetical protein